MQYYKVISNINGLFTQSIVPSNHVSTAEATLLYHAVKNHLSYKPMNCTSKLNVKYIVILILLKKVLCARLKSEAIIINSLAPLSVDWHESTVQYLEEISCFGVCTDGSNHGLQKVFPIL